MKYKSKNRKSDFKGKNFKMTVDEVGFFGYTLIKRKNNR